MFRNYGFSYNNLAAVVATVDGDDNSNNYNNKDSNNNNNNNDILNNVSVPQQCFSCNKQSSIPHAIQITRQELYY
jgi:hypothetical protein